MRFDDSDLIILRALRSVQCGRLYNSEVLVFFSTWGLQDVKPLMTASLSRWGRNADLIADYAKGSSEVYSHNGSMLPRFVSRSSTTRHVRQE